MKKEIIAFLNNDGGTIYVGVKDNSEPIPFDDHKDRDLLDVKLSNWKMEAFYPSPCNYIRHHFNKEIVLVIEISKGKEKPYYIKEKGPKPSSVYKRVESTTRMAIESEITLMLLESRQYRYDPMFPRNRNLHSNISTNYVMKTIYNTKKEI